MSIKALKWAWTVQLSPRPKVLLVTYADRAGSDDRCHPGLMDTMERTGLTKDEVLHYNGWLEKFGVLAIERGGPRKPNVYRLNVAAAFPARLKIPRPTRRGQKPSPYTTNVSTRPVAHAQPQRSATSHERSDTSRPQRSATSRHGLSLNSQQNSHLTHNDCPCGQSRHCSAASRDNDPFAIWPTATMKGYARKLGLDWLDVIDAIQAEFGLPQPGDDPEPWHEHWYGRCRGLADGFDDRVEAGRWKLAKMTDGRDDVA